MTLKTNLFEVGFILTTKNTNMKNIKYIMFVIGLCILTTKSIAQQDFHFSLYKYSMNAINPAYAGTNEKFEALVSVRSQWTGIEGSPEILNFNTNTYLGRGLGIGFNVISDKIFVQSETHTYADFSYRIPLSKNTDLFAGIKVGGTFLNVDTDKLEIDDDPLLSENVNTFNPNFGVGFYIKAENYHIHLSSPAFLKNRRLKGEKVSFATTSDKIHVFLGGGYGYFFRNRAWVFTPSVMMKMVSGSPISVDVTTAFQFREQMEFGMNYRVDESFTGFITTNILKNKMKIGYAFEYATTPIQKYGGTSHELVLKFTL